MLVWDITVCAPCKIASVALDAVVPEHLLVFPAAYGRKFLECWDY